MRVLVDAVKLLLLVLAGNAAEARARGVDKNEIACIEQALVVVDQVIGRRRGVRIVGGDDALWSKRTHMQPHCRRAGAAIVEKRDGTSLRVLAALGVVDKEHRGFRGRLLGFRGLVVGFIVALVGVNGLLHVVPVLRVDNDRARNSLVGDRRALHRHRALRDLVLGLEELGFGGGYIGIRCVRVRVRGGFASSNRRCCRDHKYHRPNSIIDRLHRDPFRVKR